MRDPDVTTSYSGIGLETVPMYLELPPEYRAAVVCSFSLTQMPHSRLSQADCYVESLQMAHPEGVFQAAFCLARLNWPELRDESGQFLHPEEVHYFSTLASERRQMSYLLGRYCAKQALARMRPASTANSICIRPGVFQHPVTSGAGTGAQVSISHGSHWGAAIAFPEEHPMAVDIEEIEDDKSAVIKTQMSKSEILMMLPLVDGETEALALLWTVKEAMSKIIRCGMMTPFTVFEVASASKLGETIRCTFSNFAQYKATCFLHEHLAISLVSPKNTSFVLKLPIRPHGDPKSSVFPLSTAAAQ